MIASMTTTTPMSILRGLAARLRLTSPTSLVADVVARQAAAETAAVSQIATIAAEVEQGIESIAAEIRAGLANDGVLDARESAAITARLRHTQTSAQTAAQSARHLSA